MCEMVPVEECEDVYKEIPFLVDDEECEDIPRLQCTEVTTLFSPELSTCLQEFLTARTRSLLLFLFFKAPTRGAISRHCETSRKFVDSSSFFDTAGNSAVVNSDYIWLGFW